MDTPHMRAYFHDFQTNGLIGRICVGLRKLRWPKAPRSINPFLIEILGLCHSTNRFARMW